MSINLYSLGAAKEVTGSKHILEVDGHIHMIDCGAFQGKRAEADNKNRNLGIEADKVESVVLTHAHYDHCGLLPLLVKRGYTGNIFATPATRDLATLIMMDSAHIQARDAEYLYKQSVRKGEKFTWQPLFNEKDVISAGDQIVTVSYNRKAFISSNITLEFFDAGHILGSGIAMLTINRPGQKNIRIAYTGDLGRKDKPIIRDPAVIPAVDYIVLESTYGNRLHEDTQIAMDELAKIVQKAIKSGGKILIPSFAIERTQELVYYFHLLVDQKRIPPIPIFVDSPMATNATSIFQIHPECYDAQTYEAFMKHHKNPFGFNALKFTASVEESKSLNNMTGPMVIISADGMCEAGRIVHHLANNITSPNTTILLVGYMAENTLGRRLQNREKEVKIMGDWYPVRASIEQINAFSAHADYREATNWLDSLDTSDLKRIFMVHGESDAQLFFKDYLNQHGYSRIDIVEYGKSYEIV